MIRLEHVTKEFSSRNKKVTAVNDVSIHISKGEIYGIIGFSGAGKSTLIRCINLLEMPTSGKVYFGNQELTSAGEKELRLVRQKMGMIFQQFNLLEQRNVLKNMNKACQRTLEAGRYGRKGKILSIPVVRRAETKGCYRKGVGNKSGSSAL